MQLHYPIALSASSYTLRPPPGRQLSKLVVQPVSAAVKVGPAPRTSTLLSGGAGLTGATALTFAPVAGAFPPGFGDLVVGRTLSGTGLPSNTYITSVEGGTVTLSAALSSDVTTATSLTVADPAVSAAGLDIAAGGSFEFLDTWMFAGGITVYSSSTTNVNLLYSFK